MEKNLSYGHYLLESTWFRLGSYMYENWLILGQWVQIYSYLDPIVYIFYYIPINTKLMVYGYEWKKNKENITVTKWK